MTVTNVQIRVKLCSIALKTFRLGKIKDYIIEIGGIQVLLLHSLSLCGVEVEVVAHFVLKDLVGVYEGPQFRFSEVAFQ